MTRSWQEPPLPGMEDAGHPNPIPAWLRPHVTHCRSCPAEIVFTITVNRKANPVDAHPHPDGNLRVYQDGRTIRSDVVRADQRHVDETLHLSHFVTCSNPEKHRKKAKR